MIADATPRRSRRKVAVIGGGVSGLSCAWLLGPAHDVTLFEAQPRLGGHANTVDAPGADGPIPVDTGFIVYNQANYPNLSAMLEHLGVATRTAEMSFGVSLDDGALEYGSAHPLALFAQPGNLVRPRFWSMIRDLVRFYREAPQALGDLRQGTQTLGEFLDRGGYSRAFQDDHLLPQVGAIWSSSARDARDYPAEALIRFFENHELLKLVGRSPWRTVCNGSRTYVEGLRAAFTGQVRTGAPVVSVRRSAAGVLVRTAAGEETRFDRVVLATPTHEALRILAGPSSEERRLLGAFRYSANRAVLHGDRSLMPRRRAAWSAWNHLGRRGGDGDFCVTYWMNALQGLPRKRDLFVTLNPHREPAPDKLYGVFDYEHPLFDTAALSAQRELWSLQDSGGIWFCGAHFGAGFHEDGLQSGLAVAEQLGGVRRPWRVAGESGRIHLHPAIAAAVAA